MSVGAIDQRDCLVRRKVCKLAFDKSGCFLLRNPVAIEGTCEMVQLIVPVACYVFFGLVVIVG